MEQLSTKKPEKNLVRPLKKSGGRGMYGHITVRHRGGGHKRRLRIVDFKRDKRDIPARVLAIEYDPSRTAHLALLQYDDGEKRYILAPKGLSVGDKVIAGKKVKPDIGNALPLKNIPPGTFVHNVELVPGKGGQIARSAGTSAQILSRQEGYVHLKMPSGEIRKIRDECFATVGQVGREEKRSVKLRKAGDKRHLGFRPAVRGVVMDPGSHPHGGGEGRSGVGLPSPKTPWGKKTLGKKTRKKKLSDKYIIKRR